jgi:hypothetical protein
MQSCPFVHAQTPPQPSLFAPHAVPLQLLWHWHWPAAVQVLFVGQLPHEPPQPFEPHSRPEHCGWHTQRPLTHLSLPLQSLSVQHCAAQWSVQAFGVRPPQRMPHDVPSHVAVPPLGVAHARHDVPHVIGLKLSTQLPEQSWVPAGH